MVSSIVQALRGTGESAPAVVARTLGVLLSCGGAIVVLALVVSPPADANIAGLYSIAVGALVLGIPCIAWSNRARLWMVHLAFGLGTGLTCLGVYFADAATGVYSVLLIWMVVIAASFFSTRAVGLHLAWMLAASGAAIATVQESGGVSPFARWTVGSLLLVVAGAMMSQIAAGRRSAEERLRSEIAERERLQHELEHLAHHDPLTGLPNRRRLEQELARELARADRQSAPLSVVVLDLDGLKAYNDSHGHAAGDRLLKLAASTWAEGLRPTDLLARTGGDEFVILLVGCDQPEAERVVARFRRAYPEGHSFSAGVACWQPHETGEELFSRADRAMYRAKARSRMGRTGFPPDQPPGLPRRGASTLNA